MRHVGAAKVTHRWLRRVSDAAGQHECMEHVESTGAT